MASSSHLALSVFVKSVHEKLRNDAKTFGEDEAWKRHCENEENLTKYALAMQQLASEHWEQNYKKQDSKAISRIQWVYEFIQNYFEKKHIENCRRKEVEVAQKMDLQINKFIHTERVQVLDVGSCYNPFKFFDDLCVTAIDIAPANNNVIKCDFLNVELVLEKCNSNPSEITRLQVSSFDVVVFSLFLEYLPSPTQRLLCCQKAYDLLKVEGVLFIITPDSKHVGSNAKIMKSWRLILSKIGFSRIKYEKLPHIHCMVFRKSLDKAISQRWASFHDQEQLFQEIVIPQDFKPPEVSTTIPKPQSEERCDFKLFDELPRFI